MEPAAEDEVDVEADAEPDDLEARATRKRRELWELHASRSADAEVPAELVKQVVSLTDEVLKLEYAAADHREDQAHRQSTRAIYLCAALLFLGSVVTLAAGLFFEWFGGWGITVLAVNLAVGLGLPAAHAAATRAGHRRRRDLMLVALVLGVVAALLAAGWLPWWAALLGVLAAVGNAIAFLATFADETTGHSTPSHPSAKSGPEHAVGDGHG